jgi:hypothetical protein
MMFDKEQWPVRKDAEARNYCGVVPNLVMVYPERKKEYAVYIQIPPDFFNLLKNVLQVPASDMENNPVTFLLEEDGDVWVFIIRLPSREYVDLWPYKDRPGWAMKV